MHDTQEKLYKHYDSSGGSNDDIARTLVKRLARFPHPSLHSLRSAVSFQRLNYSAPFLRNTSSWLRAVRSLPACRDGCSCRRQHNNSRFVW